MRAVVDWLTLASTDFIEKRAKLVTLWFDETILQVPRADMVESVIGHLRDKNKFSGETADALLQSWQPIKLHVPNWTYIHGDVWSKSDAELAKKTIAAVEKHLEIDAADKGTYGEFREVALGASHYLDLIDLWTRLNTAAPCALTPDGLGEAVLGAVLEGQKEDDSYQSFSKIVDLPIPDLSLLTWDKVIELRRDRYFENFRKKVSELHAGIAAADRAQVADLISEMRVQEMERIVRARRPAVGKAIVKGLLDNIPGLPVNPFSIGSAAKTIYDQIKGGRESGWLYFLFRLEDVGKG
jgi:hypothetical protein